MWLAVPPFYSAPIWPALGLAAYCLLSWGRHYWSVVWLAAFASDFLHKAVVAGMPPDPATAAVTAITAAGTTLVALIAARALGSLIRAKRKGIQVRRVMRALLLAAPLACMLSASTGIASMYLLLNTPADSLLGSWLTWWMADCLGVLMFAPLILLRTKGISRSEKAHIRKLQGWPLLLIVLVVIAFHTLSRTDKLQYQQRFSTVGELLHEHLERSLLMMDTMMNGTAAFMLSSVQVSPAEFQHFARHTLQPEGIEGIAWAPRVSHDQRTDFENNAGYQGREGVSIQQQDGQGRLMPATVRDHYYPLLLGAFRPGHAFAAGYDLGSEYPQRLQAVIRRGRPVLLKRHALYGVNAGTPDGWRYLLPVYESGLDVLSASKAQREAAFLGFVMGVIRLDELMQRLKQNTESLGMNFCVQLAAADGEPAVKLMDTRRQIHLGETPDWTNHPEFLADRMITVKAWASFPWQPAQSAFMWVFVLASVLVICLVTGHVILTADQNVRFAHRVRARTRSLKKARQKAADIFNNMASYVVELDRRQRIVNVNRAMFTAYGQPRAALLGLSFTELAWWRDLPREAAVFHLDFDTALNGQRTRHDVRLRHPNGGFFFVDMNIIPIRDGQGGVSRVIISAINITERKVAEQQLEQARQDAEQASRAKSYFLATMSHEIRTPLNGVIGMLDVLASTGLTRRQRDMLELVQYSATSLTELINSILEFSKIESGKIDIEPAPLAMAELVERTCLMLDQQAREQGVELTLFVDPALPERIISDSLRLRQILINLVSNAIKFSSTRQPGRVSVRACLVDQRRSAITVRFEVADNGIGMDDAIKARLFQAFTQGDASTTRRFGGTGLGLSITHRLVTLLGGEIQVQSEPEQGSCFSVSLPFELEADYTASERCDARLAGLSCLVIGENDGIAPDLLCYLRHEQARVHYAPTLAAAEQMSGLYPEGDCIWVYDATHQGFPVGELREAAARWPEHTVRFVTLERGARRRTRQVSEDHVMIDANVLNRKAFIEAIAGVAGHTRLPDRRYAEERLMTPAAAPPQQRSKARILVAEDNVVNQKVIREQLALLGYTAEIAGNGREALERWRSGAYDILLTDLGMPDMDGYQLARHIRAEEQAGPMPIIALSANAFREEMTSCIEQGMSDYLTKPVTLDSLGHMLDHWLPTSQPALADPQPHSVLDIKVLRALVGDDEQLCHELLNDYRQLLENHLPEFHQASRRREPGRLADIAHVLKSASRSVGALGLGELCEQIEASCSENKSMPSSDVIARFGLTCQEVLESINEISKGRYECETQRC